LIEVLDKLDKKIFLFLNDLHTPFLDPIMFALTNQLSWIPLFLVIIFYLFKQFKKDTLWILAGIVITITLCDQLVSSIMKPFFERLRPTHDPMIRSLIHTVNEYKGGLFGFVSAHAANSFGIATFLWLSVKDRIAWIWVLYLWAILFSYTRIYLGVHYPGDIIAGALLGIGIAYIMFFILNKVKPGFLTSDKP